MLADPGSPPPLAADAARLRGRVAGATGAVALRAAAAVAVVVVAYHTSLWSLVRGITVDTPLAYLGLVPVIALGLVIALARPGADEPDIHDRQLDVIVGVPLLAAALCALVLLPARLSTMYWLWRIDLLTMPLFVAGVIALCFGVRMLWRTKAGVLFLFLAWPIPFRAAVTFMLEPLGDLTASAVRGFVGVVPLARAVAGDGISFRIPHGPDSFSVQIASACSGANGLVGFLLVASALALVLAGGRLRKWAWVAAGCALVWTLNVVRILLILGVGRFAGRTASIEVLHPLVGLITFNLGVLLMVVLAPRFRLALPAKLDRARVVAVLRAVPDARRALILLALVAVVAGVFDHGLTAYDPISSSVGTPRLGTFSRVSTQPKGFYAEPVATLDNGKRFFGEDSSWVRYSYSGGRPGLRSDVPVLADVINTGNLQSFSDFGLEACYRFHGYDMSDARRVDLGHGVVGTVLSWQDSDTGLRWTSLYWIWAVRQGSDVRYERVVLLLNDDRRARVVAPRVTASDASAFAIHSDELVHAKESGVTGTRELELRSFLVTFGRSVIGSSADRSARLPRPAEGGQ